MIYRAKRSFFTLLEMLVVMIVLSMLCALTAIKFQQLYQQQQFVSEGQQVINQLKLAQDLMLILDTDVQVIFSKDPKEPKLTLKLYVEKSLPDAWVKLVERQLKFSAIKSYTFTSTEKFIKDSDVFVLNFNLGKMSQGNLKLSRYENANDKDPDSTITIDLPGYPVPFGPTKNENSSETIAESSSQLYPHEVYEKLYANDNA